MRSGQETGEGLSALCERHGIVLLIQFGSTVTGRTHSRSDFDLGVLLRSGRPSFREIADLIHDLEGAFPGRKVDVALLNHADPLFLRKVTERCRLLHGPEREFQRFRLYAFHRYQDYRRFLELERKYLDAALERLGAS